jgi:hypothetical protein
MLFGFVSHYWWWYLATLYKCLDSLKDGVVFVYVFNVGIVGFNSIWLVFILFDLVFLKLI